MVAPAHKSLLASLTSEERAHLTSRTNVDGVLRLIVHAGLIIVLAVLINTGMSLWWVFIVPLGVLLVFLFTLMHETTHRTAFKARSANDLLALICGWLLFLPPQWFRYFHFEHHRFTQDPDRDPELLSDKPGTLVEYIVHVSGIPVTASLIKTILKNASGRCADRFVPEAARVRIAFESRLMLLSYTTVTIIALTLGVIDVLLYCWWLPLLAGQPFLRLYLMAEHGRCPFVDNMFANTRTVFTNWLICRLAWNMPFHAEHHAYPAVPFHRLPEFHRLVKCRLQVTSNGYSDFHLQTIREHLKQ